MELAYESSKTGMQLTERFRNNFITENKNKSFQGIPFVICMSMFFMAFYMTAIYLSFRAYREFKGTMEDQLGGPDAMAEYH